MEVTIDGPVQRFVDRTRTVMRVNNVDVDVTVERMVHEIRGASSRDDGDVTVERIVDGFVDLATDEDVDVTVERPLE